MSTTAAFGGDQGAPSSSPVENDAVIIKKLFGGGGVGVVKVEEGDGSGVITQCAQFPIASFDRKNKGLTSIIQNLKVRHQKGK